MVDEITSEMTVTLQNRHQERLDINSDQGEYLMYYTQLKTDVLAAIADRPPVHVMDLAEQLDEHPITVDQTCVRLQREGYIRPARHGLYTLTDHGRQRLDESQNSPD